MTSPQHSVKEQMVQIIQAQPDDSSFDEILRELAFARMIDEPMHANPNSVAKEEAIRRLRAAGFTQEADELAAWRDVNGNNWGWDGWIRGAHPHVVETIWP